LKKNTIFFGFSKKRVFQCVSKGLFSRKRDFAAKAQRKKIAGRGSRVKSGHPKSEFRFTV
jgi:hypothetical protein